MVDFVFKVAFWNIGWQDSRLTGRNEKRHMQNISSQCASLWWGHELNALLLCEVGDHIKGLAKVSNVLLERSVYLEQLS